MPSHKDNEWLHVILGFWAVRTVEVKTYQKIIINDDSCISVDWVAWLEILALGINGSSNLRAMELKLCQPNKIVITEDMINQRTNILGQSRWRALKQPNLQTC